PQHTVTLTRAFFMKSTEVTQAEWTALMGTSPFHNVGCPTCPAEMVSWLDAVAYANAASDAAGLPRCYDVSNAFAGPTCLGFRLPTEAEWEYAARAGTTGSRYGALADIAWTASNATTSKPVATKAANAFGLYDMLGGVREWTTDYYRAYSESPLTDPVAPTVGTARVQRGGSWFDSNAFSRATFRDASGVTGNNRTLGFRVVRTAP
ncbi:MAG: formylglycine-generating enzyme family protein, partial [Myxococcales bacterium]|nr:formylglycine-generating enzyme family protein [Myxococcales bacterium]